MCLCDRGVLRQTKRLVNALKELRTAVRGSRASLEAAARKVSEYLLFFLEIGEAAVLDEPAQVLVFVSFVQSNRVMSHSY